MTDRSDYLKSQAKLARRLMTGTDDRMALDQLGEYAKECDGEARRIETGEAEQVDKPDPIR